MVGQPVTIVDRPDDLRCQRVPYKSDVGYNLGMVTEIQEQQLGGFVGVAEAAAILNCTTNHVTRLLRDGDLIGRKLSARVWIVAASSVQHFQENRPKIGRPQLAEKKHP